MRLDENDSLNVSTVSDVECKFDYLHDSLLPTAPPRYVIYWLRAVTASFMNLSAENRL